MENQHHLDDALALTAAACDAGKSLATLAGYGGTNASNAATALSGLAVALAEAAQQRLKAANGEIALEGKVQVNILGEVTAEVAGNVSVTEHKPVKHCSDERPCTPCFADQGQCTDAPKACIGENCTSTDGCGHSTECHFEHFLSYTGLASEPDDVIVKLKLAYLHGSDDRAAIKRLHDDVARPLTA